MYVVDPAVAIGSCTNPTNYSTNMHDVEKSLEKTNVAII